MDVMHLLALLQPHVLFWLAFRSLGSMSVVLREHVQTSVWAVNILASLLMPFNSGLYSSSHRAVVAAQL
jgi:hypothetical protein